MEEKIKVEILSPFGPKLLKSKIPLSTIDFLNSAIDKLISEKALKSAGGELVGQVTEEFYLPRELVDKTLRNPLNQFAKIYVHNAYKKETTVFEIKQCWIVRQYKNEYNPIHWHSGHISGVLYLKVPSNVGGHLQKNKKMESHGKIYFIHGSRQSFSQSLVKIAPSVGDIFMFPNYLMHTVYPFFESTEERRSLSFNCVVDDGIINETYA